MSQTSLAEADHYSHMATVKNIEAWWWKTNPPHPPTPPPQKKKTKRFGSLPVPQSGYATPIMVFFLLIYFAHLLITEGPYVTQIL